MYSVNLPKQLICIPKQLILEGHKSGCHFARIQSQQNFLNEFKGVGQFFWIIEMQRIHQPEHNNNGIAKSGKGDDMITFDDDCDFPRVVVYKPLDVVSNCCSRQEHDCARGPWIVIILLKE